MGEKYSEKAMKGSIFILLSVIFSSIIGYGLRLFLTRTLTIEEFGLLYAVMALFALLSLFRDFGLNHAIINYIPKYIFKKRKDKIKSSILFSVIFQICIAITIIIPILLFSETIAISYFHTIEAVLPLQIFSFMFLIGVFTGVFQNALQGFNRMDYYSLINSISSVSILISVVSLIYLGFIGSVLGFLIASIVASITSFILFQRLFPNFIKIKYRITKSFIKTILKFSFPMFLGFIGGYILGYTDTLVLTYFRTLEEVAFYQVSWATAQILWIPGSIITIMLFPIVSEMIVKKKTLMLSNGINLLTKLAFIVILPFSIVTIVFSDFIITLLFGSAYISASIVLQIFAIHAIFYTLWTVFSTTLISIGKPSLNTKIIIFIGIINLIGNIIFVPIWGIQGAAIVTTVSFILALVLTFLSLKKSIKIGIRIQDFFKATFGGLCMLTIFLVIRQIFNPTDILFMALILSFGLVFYFLFIIYTRTIRKDEIILIVRSIKMPKIIYKILIKMKIID